ncbi:MAG: restriction endonuclease subunit S [Oscillospiraceae bacterium]|nr:restriction endonuclease subunit S [Oscillospiraceae bacterium]
MDGLDCREITLTEALANKDKRIDSQFWTTNIPKNPKYTYSKIGKVILSSQYGMSIDMNTEKKGYPIFRMNELHHMLTDLEVEKYADISNIEYQAFSLQNKDVLFNRTNSYEWVGRTGIYYKNDDTPFTYASYLVKFVPDSSVILPEYLTTFLNTEIGIKAIRARARQSVNQTNVNPEEVKEIEIPLLSMKLQKNIEELFISANSHRLQALDLYRKAEMILDDILHVPSYSAAIAHSEKSLSESFLKSGRLDAEYYHPKYDALFKTLSKHPTITLGGNQGLVFIKKSIEPGSEAYLEEGIPFIRVSDVDKYEISTPPIMLSKDIVPNIEDLYPKKDTILLSKDGSIGIAYKLEKDMEAVTSGALLHLTVKDSNVVLPDYLTLVLNSPIVQLQAERDCNGAVIQHWKPSDVEKVLIPVLDMTKQREISDKVQESFLLREESKRLLDLAVNTVEMAIEADEETALLWLEAQK